MKHDMQEPLSNSLLTRRASLLALVAAPGAISAGLTGRTALADDHEPLAVFRNMTPENWAALYQDNKWMSTCSGGRMTTFLPKK